MAGARFPSTGGGIGDTPRIPLPASLARVGAGSSPTIATLYAPPPTGTASIDTPALQTLINYAVVGSATDTRATPKARTSAQAQLKLQPGTYAINAPLTIYGCFGFRMEGAGALTTTLAYQGTGVIASLIDIQGCSNSVLAHFTLAGGSTTSNYPTTVLNIDADPTLVVGGSGEHGHVHNVYIDGWYVTGIGYGMSSAANSQDVYHWLFERVDVYGSQTAGSWSNATLAQTGVQLGKTGAGLGNVLTPYFLNCNIASHINGVVHNSVGVAWDGGALQDNKVDVNAAAGAVADTVVYRNVRSEDSGKLLVTAGGPGTCQEFRLENIVWTSANVDVSKMVISHGLGGHFIVDNVTLRSTTAGDNLLVTVGGANGRQMADFRNFSLTRTDSNPDPSAWLAAGGGVNVNWSVMNIGALDVTDGVIQDLLPGPVTNHDVSIFNDVNHTVVNTDKVVALSALTAARTITLQALSGVSVGRRIRIQDSSYQAAAHNITIAAAAGNGIYPIGGTVGLGTVTISTNGGHVELMAMSGAQWIVLDSA